jgi:transcriptional regulator with XRE-family HTH domain
MSVRPSPTVRRRRLRYELRRLRTERGYTHEQVQELSGGDLKAPTMSRWENGERSVRPTDLRLLLDIYDIHDERREVLLTLGREAKERGWWQPYVSAIPDWFQAYVGLETEATTIRNYTAELVDGLLQTADYYHTFLRAARSAGSDDDIERVITVRLERQERLTGDDPAEYWAVLNEAVIRRVVGGPKVMREQLQHIAELAKLPHVNIQVLPFSAGVHSSMEGGFSILGFPEPNDPDLVYLENQAGSLYLETEPEIDRYTRMFSHLMAMAVGPDESRRLVLRVADELRE